MVNSFNDDKFINDATEKLYNILKQETNLTLNELPQFNIEVKSYEWLATVTYSLDFFYDLINKPGSIHSLITVFSSDDFEKLKAELTQSNKQEIDSRYNTKILESNIFKNQKTIFLQHSFLPINYIEDCPQCYGTGEIDCYNCGGTGHERCGYCAGAGCTVDPTGKNAILTCSYCGGSGSEICSSCQGTGRQTCPQCGGSKHFTKIADPMLLLNYKIELLSENDEIDQELHGDTYIQKEIIYDEQNMISQIIFSNNIKYVKFSYTLNGKNYIFSLESEKLLYSKNKFLQFIKPFVKKQTDELYQKVKAINIFSKNCNNSLKTLSNEFFSHSILFDSIQGKNLNKYQKNIYSILKFFERKVYLHNILKFLFYSHIIFFIAASCFGILRYSKTMTIELPYIILGVYIISILICFMSHSNQIKKMLFDEKRLKHKNYSKIILSILAFIFLIYFIFIFIYITNKYLW